MNKETFTELERLRTALTELETCSVIIKDAKVVTEASIRQVQETVESFAKASDKLILLFQDESKLLSEIVEKIITDFNKYLTQISEVIGKGLTDTSNSIDNLNKQLANQLDSQFQLLNSALKTLEIVKTKLVDVEKENYEMSNRLLLKQEHNEKEFAKMFEKVSKENNLLKILLFISLGLTIGQILFSVIPGI
jgi:hypothetical protein